MQLFIKGNHCDLWDVFADCVGLVVSSVMVLLMFLLYCRKQKGENLDS